LYAMLVLDVHLSAQAPTDSVGLMAGEAVGPIVPEQYPKMAQAAFYFTVAPTLGS
jgi:hypothetical protein